MATYSKVCSNVGGFTFGDRFTLYVVLTNRDGDPSTNKSVVDYNVYFQNTSGGGTFTSRTRLYFALNGGGIKDTTSEITGPRNGSVTIASGSTTIDHNNDGTKSISYHALVQSATFGIKGEISGTFTLNTIPRASSITCSTANIGSNPTITITSASTSFVHNVYGAFGSLNFSVFSNVKGGTYTSWTIPTDFYSQIPNSRTGKGTLYCQTYSGSTLVGTTSVQLNVTTSESACRPTVTGTVVDTNATTIALTGNKNKLVLGKSTAQITVTPVAKNSATIKSVTIDGVATTNNTRTIAKVSKISFPIAVTDSREYPSAAYSVIASGGSVPYEDLSFNATIFRPQPTGTEIQMKYSGKYYNGSFGAVSNTLSITWKYKVKGASSWTNGGTITPTLSGNTISSKTISLGTSYNYQTAYDFQITAVDKLTTNTQTIAVSVGMPTFYWGKDFMQLGSPFHKFQADGSATDNRKLSIDTGNYNFNVSSTSGWANGLKFRKNDGETLLGWIGAYGSENALEYYFIGNSYDNAQLKIFPTGKVEAGWQFRTDKGGNYISARDNATVRNNSSGQSAGNSFNTVAAQKTTSGCWNIGNLSGEETLKFLYTTDSNYNSGNNSGYYTVTMPRTTGTIQLAPTSLFHNDSGVTGTVPLSETAANFNYIEVFYGRDTANSVNGYTSTKVFAPNGKRISLSHLWNINDGSIQIQTQRAEVNGTSITRSAETYVNVVNTGSVNGGTQSSLKIFKVIGWK